MAFGRFFQVSQEVKQKQIVVLRTSFGQNSELKFVCSTQTQDDENPFRNILRLASVEEMIQLRFLASYTEAMNS
jgi:hypothetical protein